MLIIRTVSQATNDERPRRPRPSCLPLIKTILKTLFYRRSLREKRSVTSGRACVNNIRPELTSGTRVPYAYSVQHYAVARLLLIIINRPNGVRNDATVTARVKNAHTSCPQHQPRGNDNDRTPWPYPMTIRIVDLRRVWGPAPVVTKIYVDFFDRCLCPLMGRYSIILSDNSRAKRVWTDHILLPFRFSARKNVNDGNRDNVCLLLL